jgi:hypothetical protein
VEEIMRNFLVLATAAFALTACSGGNDKSDESPAVATPAKSMPAFAVKPGLWEIKITFKSIEAKGLPEAAKKQMMAAMGNGITVKNCVTKEQSKKPGAEFFGSPNSSNCAMNTMDVSGDRMSVKLTCKPDANAVIENSMNGTFADDSYSMDVQQKTSGTPMGDLITAGKIDGKRLGDCPA